MAQGLLLRPGAAATGRSLGTFLRDRPPGLRVDSSPGPPLSGSARPCHRRHSSSSLIAILSDSLSPRVRRMKTIAGIAIALVLAAATAWWMFAGKPAEKEYAEYVIE